jgi:hypothetical protein
VNHYTRLILVQIVKQVPLGILSAGDPKALSSIERPALSRGITGVVGRDI